ncbi:Aste57867_23495 [Aphanomyces stellatus]|uniref:Aste57867_23495 protein n=1 Tax=Aphanomyces stellatus TaxID=120398 RepID=A0A485LMZ3_9STRA|nr:hypothetical protein As57867_023424 [Aphanomyces stellatus]VFU00140.1 Aste57867_23495 [Aphanomyces stellatus]
MPFQPARALWNLGASLIERRLHPNKQALAGLGLLRPHVWKARVGLMDLGVAAHMNNAAAIANMELARWHNTGVSGMFELVVAHKWMFLAGANMIRYRHEIPPFAAYAIHSDVIFWDDTWFFFRHRFVCPTTGKLFIEGVTRVVVKDSHRNTISLPQIAKAMGIGPLDPNPEMPETVKAYLRWDAATKRSMEGGIGSEQTKTG